MSAVLTTGKKTAVKLSAEDQSAKAAAIQEWAKAQLSDDQGVIAKDKVVIVPTFKKTGKKWLPTDEVVTAYSNGTHGYMLVYGAFQAAASTSIGSMRWAFGNENSTATGNGNLTSAIVSGPLEWLQDEDAGFSAGDLLTGRIDTFYDVVAPNPNDDKQDLHYISADARRLGIPACDKDGQPIYSVKAYVSNLNAPKPTAIPIANRAQINLAIAAAAGK